MKPAGIGWRALLFFALGVAVYTASLTAPFVFDDYEAIVTNPHVRQLSSLTDAASAPRDTPTAGRPLVALSFAANYAIGGVNPLGYHLVNLAIHILNGLLLFGIVRRTLSGTMLRARWGKTAEPIAVIAALIWLTHPLQTDAVTYVTQRTESMMGLCYLLTLYCAIRAMGSSPAIRSWSALSVVACAGGMLCKESMVTAPLMVLLYDLAFEARGLGEAVRRRPYLYGGLYATWGVALALLASNPRGRSAGLDTEFSPWTYFLNQPHLILRYLALSVWPSSLVLDYGVPQSVPISQAAPYALVVAAFFVASMAAWRAHRPLAFLGTWFFVTLALTSSVVPLAGEVGAERRMYLPLAAVVIAVVTAAAGAWTRLAPRLNVRAARMIALASAVTVVGLLGALTLRRNIEYQDPVGLWQTTVLRYPQPRAHYGLGLEFDKKGLPDEARHELRLATVGYPKAYYALGVLAEQDGRHAEAVESLREYIHLRPHEEEAVNAFALIGQALAAEGRFAEAAAAYRQVLSMQPWNHEARANLAAVYTSSGLAFIAAGREAEAVGEFSMAVDADPDDAGKQENLGHALSAVGQMDEAIGHYEKALTLAPRKASLHSALGGTLVAAGRTAEGIRHFEVALSMAPQDEAVRADITAAQAALNRRPQTCSRCPTR